MSTHVITRRAHYLISVIQSIHYPSKENILDFLKENRDTIISERTLERDFERIATDFGIEIKYSKLNNGYYIDKNESFKVDTFFRYSEMVSISDIFNDSLKNNNKALENVTFDDSKSFKGIENISIILLAINQKRKLLFDHFSYQKGTTKKYEITPLHLREYENRWYVLGVPDDHEMIWSFGIDRISNPQLGKLYSYKKFFKKGLEKYNDIIGISLEEEDPKEKIKVGILVDEEHVNYLKSLPLHQSQIVNSEKVNGKQLVSFLLIPNYEFKVQILKMGTKCEVIEPIELRNQIVKMLEVTLKNYR